MYQPKEDELALSGTKFKKKQLSTQVSATSENTVSRSSVMDGRDVLKSYIRNSGVVAKAYGLRIEGRVGNRKLVVADLEMINGFDEGIKGLLRELLREGEY
jgi:hypothetical protein